MQLTHGPVCLHIWHLSRKQLLWENISEKWYFVVKLSTLIIIVFYLLYSRLVVIVGYNKKFAVQKKFCKLIEKWALLPGGGVWRGLESRHRNSLHFIWMPGIQHLGLTDRITTIYADTASHTRVLPAALLARLLREGLHNSEMLCMAVALKTLQSLRTACSSVRPHFGLSQAQKKHEDLLYRGWGEIEAPALQLPATRFPSHPRGRRCSSRALLRKKPRLSGGSFFRVRFTFSLHVVEDIKILELGILIRVFHNQRDELWKQRVSGVYNIKNFKVFKGLHRTDFCLPDQDRDEI